MCTRTSSGHAKERVRLWNGGEHEAARELDRELQPSIELLRAVTNPIAIKAALNLLGHEVGGHRLLVDATEEERERVRDCLARLGLLQPAATV